MWHDVTGDTMMHDAMTYEAMTLDAIWCYATMNGVTMHDTIAHGGLYRWRENSLPSFLYQKLKEILTRYGHFDQHEA